MVLGIIAGVIGIATSIVQSVAGALTAVGMAMTTIGGVIENIGRGLGLISDFDKVETLGRQCKAAEEDGIRPDDFESFDDYVARIRKIEVDENVDVDELENKDEITKKGMDLIMGLAVEKYGQQTMDKVGDIVVASPEKADLIFSSKSVSDYVSGDRDNLERVADYIKGNNQSGEVLDIILNAVEVSKPELSDKERLDFVNEIRDGLSDRQ